MGCLKDLSGRTPLIAIMRGIEPKDAVRVGGLLINEGFTLLEVPLNSPDALLSIKLLVKAFGDDCLVGAGTVTTPEAAQQVVEVGARLIVTPNYNAQVIKIGADAGCAVFVGVLTPTEAFSALAEGATGVKLFPVNVMGIDGFKALKSVLPVGTLCYPVGGIDPTVESMGPFISAGADGFGLGSSLYKPSMCDSDITSKARTFVSVFKRLSVK